MNERRHLRWGIVGCGNIAAFHARALRELDGVQIAACTDTSAERARRFAAEWETKACPTLDSLFQANLDAISVCTPNATRSEVVLAAIDRHVHVITEKPIGISLESIDEMIEAADRRGVLLGCIVQTRFGDAEQKLRELVDNEALGRLVLGEADVRWQRSQEYYDSGSWRGTWEFEGGGALINQAIHTIDLLQWYVGPVKRIGGVAATLARRIEVEDTAGAVLEFQSGAVGVIKGTTSIAPGFPRRLGLYGSRASAELVGEDLLLYDEETPNGRVLVADRSAGRTDSDPLAFPHENHRRQLVDFISAMVEGRAPLVDGREARKPVEIILAIYQASRASSFVELPMRAV